MATRELIDVITIHANPELGAVFATIGQELPFLVDYTTQAGTGGAGTDCVYSVGWQLRNQNGIYNATLGGGALPDSVAGTTYVGPVMVFTDGVTQYMRCLVTRTDPDGTPPTNETLYYSPEIRVHPRQMIEAINEQGVDPVNPGEGTYEPIA